MISSLDFGLMLVTDRRLAGGRPLEDVVEAAVRGGVTAVQLREKDCPTREFLEIARCLLSRLDRAGIPLIINDRVDIALAAGAAGVHLGQDDLPVLEARRLLGPGAIIGLSVETPEQAAAADAWDVSYLGVSPVFATPTKTGAKSPWGLDGLRRLRALSRRTLVAIGGINASNAADVLASGADGLAVVSAVCAAPDPEAAARRLRDIVDRGRTAAGKAR
jgi:thiamine-phosphate pyrophosphorylase